MKQNLRTRLIATLLCSLAVGLLIMGIATVFGTKFYLDNKTNQQLTSSMHHATNLLENSATQAALTANNKTTSNNEVETLPPEMPPQQHSSTPSGPPPLMEPQAARISSTGTVERLNRSTFGSDFNYSNIPQKVLQEGQKQDEYFDVSSQDQDYRGIVFPLTSSTDVGVVVVPTGDIKATLKSLTLILLVIGLTILLAAALISWRLVVLGLTPLNHMAEVTEAIADGLTKERVTPAQDAEMARLGNSINRAFDTRDASEKRLRAFIADASHELRTPLTSIRGYAELINSGAVNSPEKLNKASTRIENEATRLGAMVQDLLTIARLDEGKNLEIRTMNIVPIIDDVISDAKVIDPNHKVTYHGPQQFIVNTDQAALQQILTNLLANIRAHTPEGTPAEITCQHDSQWNKISVRDYGPGLSEEDQAKIFNRFWRQNPSRRIISTDQQSGSGLGLAIVSGLVHGLGGHVKACTPEEGPGLCIEISLPKQKP
ncbi:MAG: HAMP domain-containing sensor histidine kinase [Micrococcaceae bacterium]